MSVYHQSEMKVPIRPAPPPPVNANASQKAPRPNVILNGSTRNCHNKVNTTIPKKKPPPRPPPPKFINSKPEKKYIPARPSQLITNLFHKRSNTTTSTSVAATTTTTITTITTISKPIDHHQHQTTFRSNPEGIDSKGNNVLSLIDFNSPPSSPTFTTRSSSDALSVNSFGSDGVTPCSNSSGNTSNVESGFEDDFDFFLGPATSKKSDVRDPWSLASQDQCQRQKNPSPLLLQNQKSNSKNSTWTAFSSLKTTVMTSSSSSLSSSLSTAKKNLTDNLSAMPTIIRVKPEKQKPFVNGKVNNSVSSNINVLAEIFENSHQTMCGQGTTLFENVQEEEEDDEDDDGWSSESPPMPTGPPPAPPLEALHGLLDTSPFVLGSSGRSEKAHGVALYDYKGDHPDDLSFKESDVINLVRRIDENWYVGEAGGREGTVPANFISVRIPLAEDSGRLDGHRVTALYTFRPETWEDLGFGEGTVIKVLGRINQDWLYGEANGRTGQFPAIFVDHVPSDLPLHKK